MIAHFPKEDRVRYGLLYESYLIPVLSDFLHDTLQKTSYCYSMLDFFGSRTWSELKVRTSNHKRSDPWFQDGWLLPACKFLEAAEKSDNQTDVWFFYLWESDGSLWGYKFNPDDMNRFPLRVPSFHNDNQLHYYVPESEFQLVGHIDIHDNLKNDKCLILD